MPRPSILSSKVQLRGLDDVTRKDSAIQTLASFEVEAGRAQVRRTDSA